MPAIDRWTERMTAAEQRQKDRSEPQIPPIDGGGGGPHDPDMDQRVAKLESEVGEIKGLLADKIMPMLIRIDERTTHMASKSDTEALRAELGDKPGKTYMWAVLGVLVATILAAVAVGASIK